jgi:hypothetical protein
MNIRPFTGLGLATLIALGAAAGCGSPMTHEDAGPGSDALVPDGPRRPVPDGLAGDARTDGPTCLDKCTKGVSQCVNAQIQTCVLGPSGCTDWEVPKDCPGGKACNAGACPSCTDNCTFGNTQCSGTKVQKCTVAASGCFDWATPESCPGGLPCSNNACPTCVDKCTVGTTKCLGSQVQTCTKPAGGCADWGAPQNCPDGTGCVNDKCPTCTNECLSGATQCSGTQIKTCAVGSDGCTHWGPAEDCPNGKACILDTCPNCTDKCQSGQTQCSGTLVQTCELKATGCLDWSVAAACPGGGLCQNDKCAGCNPGEHRCNGNALEVCNSSSQWQLQQLCAQACDPKTLQCQVTVTCTAGARRCNGNQVQICNATGTAWLTAETCNVSCQNGLCTGACTPGATRCNGNTPETCNSIGNAWTASTPCTTFCFKGACAQPSLTVDADANKTLDGEQVFAGDVVIKNSSVVKVPSGKLIIRAKKVIIDASSSISVTATGNDPRGKGADGGSASCTASCYSYPYSCTATGTVGGGGGGYSAAGGGASSSLSCYCSGTKYCSVTRAGGQAYAYADDEAASGASGGACSGTPGGKGGGLLAIYAEQIVVQGSITADGQSGSGCAGGGSGGGILLRATQDLTFSGSASVAAGQGGSSGAGSGALGVIKLLYGNAKSITGTTTGKVFSSYMPPDDQSSSTHPLSSRWYNDGFDVFEVAWSRPFTQSGGYYTKLNQSYAFVPAPATSDYQTQESIQFQASKLVAGPNYLHVSVVGPAFDPSTIESRYLVQINSTPPSVSSQSHPSQSTWYPNANPFLTWTLPRPDENTARFYWVLDRFANTIPDKSATSIPMNLADPESSKRLLLSGLADGIWFFHLIAEDTMGYLTKAGASFRLQIGADPGKGGVSGNVTDAGTGAFISGVTVTLNRGVHTTTTNSQGAYAFTNNTVFAQDYEIRASKTGYKTSAQTVSVKAGQTATVNFSLTAE